MFCEFRVFWNMYRNIIVFSLYHHPLAQICKILISLKNYNSSIQQASRSQQLSFRANGLLGKKNILWKILSVLNLEVSLVHIFLENIFRNGPNILAYLGKLSVEMKTGNS